MLLWSSLWLQLSLSDCDFLRLDVEERCDDLRDDDGSVFEDLTRSASLRRRLEDVAHAGEVDCWKRNGNELISPLNYVTK